MVGGNGVYVFPFAFGFFRHGEDEWDITVDTSDVAVSIAERLSGGCK